MPGSTSDNKDDTPRWVKVSGIIGAVVVILVLILLFAGHGPSRHIPSDNKTVETNP